MPTNPTSVPSLDVEACVRLLKEVARDYERQAEADEARGYEPFQRTTDIAAMLRALASALPGMGKDSQPVAWRILAKDGSVWSLHFHREAAKREMARLDAAKPNYVSPVRLDPLYSAAARAAQPEETSADAE